MTWSAIYRLSDGALHSVGSVVTEKLSKDYGVKVLSDQPDPSRVVWDKAKLEFVPVPQVPLDPVQEAVAEFANLDVSAMTQTQLIALIVKALKFMVKRELNRG
jgi:hypothetical protein